MQNITFISTELFDEDNMNIKVGGFFSKCSLYFIFSEIMVYLFEIEHSMFEQLYFGAAMYVLYFNVLSFSHPDPFLCRPNNRIILYK